MIIVKLMGGMGNQMFQYAFGRNLSIKYNVPLKIDLSFLKNRNMGHNFVYRDYDLDIFHVHSDFEIGYINNLYTANEPHFHYSQNFINAIENTLKSGNSILLDGYWQSYLYFKEYEEIIREDFKFRDNVELTNNNEIDQMVKKIKESNSVLINVRRTDYLNTNFHGVMGMDYINNARTIIESKVDNPHYFIFSDDVDWCRENMKFDNMTIVDHSYKGEKFGYYLQLMSKCKHFIIPNSSFAWWAAWMNTDDSKIVISPKQWFTDNNINTNDLIPSNWIRI